MRAQAPSQNVRAPIANAIDELLMMLLTVKLMQSLKANEQGIHSLPFNFCIWIKGHFQT